MRETVERILDPETIAIVGASDNPNKRGYQAIETLQAGEFDGRIYPINPSTDEIRGLPVRASIADVPEAIDVALVVVPRSIVPSVLEDCADVDVGGAVVVAVGFGETGEAGAQLEERILSLARENDVRIVGPNTSGLINVHTGANLVGADGVPAGNLALLCQSGNLAIALFSEAAGRAGVGFSQYVGVGNEADLQFHEYLPYLEQEERTDAIVCYVEGLSDGRAFLEAARKTVEDTPIIVCKSGRSTVGKRSASSHTASLAGDAAIADAAFKQAGVVSVERSDELLATANALSSLPPMDGSDVAVLADGGGHATLAADALTDRGLSVPELSAKTQTQLQELLPDAASVRNPVDVAGGTDDDPAVFTDCARALFEDPNVDALLLSGLFGGYGIRFSEDLASAEETAATEIADLARQTDVPLIVQSAYEGADPPAHEVLRERGIPVHESLDVSVAGLSGLSEYGDHLQAADRKGTFAIPPSPGEETNPSAIQRDGRLTEYEAKELIGDMGAPVTPFTLAASPTEAESAAESFDDAVAIKIVSPDVAHKTDIGGVALDVTAENAADTYEQLLDNTRAHDPAARIDGVLVSPMRTEGVEVIVGATRDRQFGPMVMFGLGGVFVEVVQDIAFRAAPVTGHDARELIDEIDARELLDGARGRPPVDRDSLVDVLVSVSDLISQHPEVSDVDLNPVLAGPEGAEILDASIRIDSGAKGDTAASRSDAAPLDRRNIRDADPSDGDDA